MGIKAVVCAGALAALAIVSTACRGPEPIDPDTALSLLKDRTTEPVRVTFSATVPENATPSVKDAYTLLMDAHVITCKTTAVGKLCQPGPAGDALTLAGSAELGLVAGRWAPSSVTSISRSGGNAATAEVHMRFEPSPLYRDFEGAFDAIQIWSGQSAMDNKKEGKIAHAVFQHLEDGWRLESLT